MQDTTNKTIQNNYENQMNSAKSGWKIEIVNTNKSPKENKDGK